MPIQFPKTLINTPGVHRLDEHVQAVMIAVASGSADVYLPPATVVAAPIYILNRSVSRFVTIRPQRGKTISGGDFHRMPDTTLFKESRLTLVPSVNSSGDLDGNWTIIGGNCANFYNATAALQSVDADTTFKFEGLEKSFDAIDAIPLSGFGWTPKEVDFYDVTMMVIGVGLTAGTVVQAAFTPDGSSELATMQSFTSQGGTSDAFQFGVRLRFLEDTAYFPRVRHNDAGGAKFFGLGLFHIFRCV